MVELGAIGMILVADEVRRVVDDVSGRETPETMSDRIARAAWAEGTGTEAEPIPTSPNADRTKRTRRLLWQVGELFVRSGQWLQDRFCVEPACA